mmetsp:Transcript_17435/g.25788  ORF Transcript_17435/g.25788 Transcript_17435/m.25788 type:complete len:92 (-) Transcript_17435:569-844(-)
MSACGKRKTEQLVKEAACVGQRELFLTYQGRGCDGIDYSNLGASSVANLVGESNALPHLCTTSGESGKVRRQKFPRSIPGSYCRHNNAGGI